MFYNKVIPMPELGNTRRPPSGIPMSTSLNGKENGAVAEGASGADSGHNPNGGTHGHVAGAAGKEWNFLATLKNLKKWSRKRRSVKLTVEENASRSPSEKSDASSSSSGNQTIVDVGDLEVFYTFAILTIFPLSFAHLSKFTLCGVNI